MKKIQFAVCLPAFFLFLGIIGSGTSALAQVECDIYAVQEWAAGDNDAFRDRVVLRSLHKQGIDVNQIVRHTDLISLRNEIVTNYNQNGCTCIRNLHILGHGSEGWISAGESYLWPSATGHLGYDNEQVWKTTLNTLQLPYCTDAQINLFGCSVGACNLGQSLLSKLANAYFVKVTAPVDTMWLSELGTYLTNTSRLQVATPGVMPAHKAKNPKKKGPRRPPVSLPTKKYACDCNGSDYDDLQTCVNNCSVSLKCFTGVCYAKYVPGDHGDDGSSLNPVADLGPAGSWESTHVWAPSVMAEGPNQYKMWYSGSDDQSLNRIGYAESPYGFSWQRSSKNPVLSPGATGTWEECGVYHPSVIKDGTTYRMWYQGFQSEPAGAPCTKKGWSRIGYASSDDGLTWTKYSGNPVLNLGSWSWDNNYAGDPSVIKDGNLFKMWFSANSGNYGINKFSIGYATSPDGVTWTRHNVPVLTHGPDGSWDEYGVAMPAVIKEQNGFQMFYSGFDKNDNYNIGHAISTDGINWTKSPFNPYLLAGSGIQDWNYWGISDPSFVKDSNESIYKIFHSGFDQYDTYRIGFSTLAAQTLPEPVVTNSFIYLPLVIR